MADGYGPVADLLAENLRNGREVGASIGVYRGGRPVVRIWGGQADPGGSARWTERTLTPMASVSKALASSALLVLVDRGEIGLEAPVASYWPAFGQAGKHDIPVRLVLSHRSGVAALDEPVGNDDAAALDPVLRSIERQRLWWQPGTRHGYHAITYGFLVSGLVRAVTGLIVGRFFAEEIARPLGLDLHLGLPVKQHGRVAPMIGPTHRQALRALTNPRWLPYARGLVDRRSVTYRATFGGTSAGFDDHAELVRYEVEDPSAGGVGNGPSLARLFAALIGPVGGQQTISAEVMNAARQPQAQGRDEVLRMRTDWGLGFALPGGPLWPGFGVPGVFGHSGASGSLASPTPNTTSPSATPRTCGPNSAPGQPVPASGPPTTPRRSTGPPASAAGRRPDG